MGAFEEFSRWAGICLEDGVIWLFVWIKGKCLILIGTKGDVDVLVKLPVYFWE